MSQERVPGLVLDRPRIGDLDDVFEIFSDPRVWTHFPSGRMTSREEAESFLLQRIADWEVDGLGTWIVREEKGGPMLGSCGCSVRRLAAADDSVQVGADDSVQTAADGPVLVEAFWNLGYRFRPEVQGRGYASWVASLAIAEAQARKPELPVVAYLLEHNIASKAVAEKIGLVQQHRAPDAGNPDPQAIRLVYADRELDARQLDATLR
ncbi:MAG: GNAT family N-acetyltransferase [Brevibacterium sp.]